MLIVMNEDLNEKTKNLLPQNAPLMGDSVTNEGSHSSPNLFIENEKCSNQVQDEFIETEEYILQHSIHFEITKDESGFQVSEFKTSFIENEKENDCEIDEKVDESRKCPLHFENEVQKRNFNQGFGLYQFHTKKDISDPYMNLKKNHNLTKSEDCVSCNNLAPYDSISYNPTNSSTYNWSLNSQASIQLDYSSYLPSNITSEKQSSATSIVSLLDSSSILQNSSSATSETQESLITGDSNTQSASVPHIRRISDTVSADIQYKHKETMLSHLIEETTFCENVDATTAPPASLNDANVGIITSMVATMSIEESCAAGEEPGASTLTTKYSERVEKVEKNKVSETKSVEVFEFEKREVVAAEQCNYRSSSTHSSQAVCTSMRQLRKSLDKTASPLHKRRGFTCPLSLKIPSPLDLQKEVEKAKKIAALKERRKLRASQQ